MNVNTYLVSFQRKIGEGDWETVKTQYDVCRLSDNIVDNLIVDDMKVSSLEDISISEGTLCHAFGIIRENKRWHDGVWIDRNTYRYSKFNPYISLRIRYTKYSISFEELMKHDSELVIEYLKERGITVYPKI